MTATEVESRLAALEKEVASLKRKQGHAAQSVTHPVRVLEQTHATFENDEAFKEAARLGRQWRKSLDAKPRRKSKTRRK